MFDTNTRVLVVDDMITMRKMVAKLMKDLGFEDILEASDGAKAWDELSKAEPAVGLVVSDWNMPNLTGLDFLKKVRADSRFAKLPFLMVTAEAEQHQIVEAIKAGVSNYVIKPFTPQTLKDKLEAIHQKVISGK